MTGAYPFKAGNINDTYRGSVLVETGQHAAIIKDLEPKELANEVMSSALGLLLGLPIPQPVLAWASSEVLAASKGPPLEDGRLLFASLDVSQPQVAMLYRGGGGKRVLARLAEWAKLGQLYGFDSLVANIDRHAGNILFSGNREVWLIDHGHCFTGPQWQPVDLVPPDQETPCRLNEWLTPVLDDKQRNDTASDAAMIEIEAAKLDVTEIALANHMETLLSDGDLGAVLEFVMGRYPHVPRLAASALGVATIL